MRSLSRIPFSKGRQKDPQDELAKIDRIFLGEESFQSLRREKKLTAIGKMYIWRENEFISLPSSLSGFGGNKSGFPG
jgi:hypothetical protein